MAPSPEYDKEPKAPDKSGTNISSEDTKLLHNLINDQHNSSDHKTTNSATNSEVENTKHVETLDDDKLRALLNEALTYKCPKDREGKSSLFKELLQEVEQDDQEACEAAARTVCRGGRRARGPRGALPHSNSLQDLVAALAAEPAPRRAARHPAPAPHTVAARAIHGGSLPSGVDTSSLLSEEGSSRCGGAGYLATVRCVNPPPLAERRVSASDANAPHDLELLNRRSKPMFPMTYTARATLEIGSGSVCSGRAVTTTTASNQMSHISPPPADNATGGTDAHALNPSSGNNDIELEEIVCHRATKDNRDTFSDYLADQEKLFQVLEATRTRTAEDEYSVKVLENNNNIKSSKHDVEPVRKSHDVDSAIPFSCITTPEVVASCNTTPSAASAAVAIDPKPLQLASEYRSVASLVAPAPPAPAAKEPEEQPRSVIATSFNGLPLSRPHYASAASSSEEYKKSLDENGNSVQGYSSPLSGSSQHKKPRRKKSSRNETVIDCRQLDGYQGDKDVNELLRFIESAEQRAPKLRKHKDDADDKGKKRSAERRKDKEHKPARAASLDELSRCREPPRAPPAKPERRSWGDAEPAPTDAPPDLGFQTVTKKRRARRRAEEAPRRPRAAAARRHDCARSDRSNDSTDDMDSVHSLPPPAPPPPALASYADIARTRHNIPDLIESCNFYAEGEGEPEPAAPPDAYPALEARAASPPPAAACRERKPPPPAPAPDSVAPDVVADRRPPVILLDSAARPRDLDGVTFGFDINEQLLDGGARRPRCDLLRDAVDAPPAPAPAPPPPSAVPVRAAKRALHYVPPPPPPDRDHMLQIVDYIGAAWEEAVRCGGGKVRYFSE